MRKAVALSDLCDGSFFDAEIPRRYDSARKTAEKNPFIDSYTSECYI